MTDDPTDPTPEDAARDAAADAQLPTRLVWVRCDNPWCTPTWQTHGHRVRVRQ